MKKILLGIALLTIFSALGVGPASAAKFTINSGEYPATVSTVATNENVISNGTRSITCKVTAYNGTMSGPSEKLALTPSFSECTANGGIPVTVTPPVCTFGFEVTISFPLPSINILTCSGFAIHIYFTKHNHSTATAGCSYEVAPSTLSEVPATNEGSGSSEHVRLAVASKTLVIKRTAGTLVNCGPAETKAGSYTGNLDMTAKNKAGSSAGLMIG